ncbi:hypothetical protein [Rhizobium leguminosarum]|uniref:hypothetical protein n=2 Tax=Rhizobium TaxID=379 RepID=UPI002F925BED
MSDAPRILTLDLASRFGWTFGVAGGKPVSGSRYFTRDGGPPKGGPISNGAKFWNAMRFISGAIEDYRPTNIVCEMPIAPSSKQGQTSTAAFEILYGLPAAVRGMAYGLGVYEWEYATPSTVRKHFIGNGGMKGEDAKPIVFRKCLALGWISADDEDLSHDRSDALAIWSWAEAKLAPKLAQPVDDLFLKAASKKRSEA